MAPDSVSGGGRVRANPDPFFFSGEALPQRGMLCLMQAPDPRGDNTLPSHQSTRALHL